MQALIALNVSRNQDSCRTALATLSLKKEHAQCMLFLVGKAIGYTILDIDGRPRGQKNRNTACIIWLDKPFFLLG